MEEEKVAFVIMPFSNTTSEHKEEYWTGHFEKILKPTIEKVGLKAERSDELRGDILAQIINKLVFSYVVVAELTDLNPNVFWELGVRQSFKHRTITIAQNDTPLPFDVGHKHTHFYYPQDHLKMTEFYKQFEKALRSCLDEPDKSDSQVLEVLGGRGTLFQIFQAEQTNRRLEALEREFDANIKIINEIEEDLKNAEKSNSHVCGLAYCFETACLELLVAQCYIELNSEFYETAADTLLLLNRYNAMFTETPKNEKGEFLDIANTNALYDILQRNFSELKHNIHSLTEQTRHRK